MDILRKYQENNMNVTEYTHDGETASTIVKEAICEEITPIQTPTLDDRLTGMENTLDLILLKQEGIL